MQTLHNIWRWYMSAFEANWWSTFFFSIPALIIVIVIGLLVVILFVELINDIRDNIRWQKWDEVIGRLIALLFFGGIILGVITLLP